LLWTEIDLLVFRIVSLHKLKKQKQQHWTIWLN